MNTHILTWKQLSRDESVKAGDRVMIDTDCWVVGYIARDAFGFRLVASKEPIA